MALWSVETEEEKRQGGWREHDGEGWMKDEMKQEETEEMGMENEGIDGGQTAVCGWATWKWKWATAGLKLGHPAINRVQWGEQGL